MASRAICSGFLFSSAKSTSALTITRSFALTTRPKRVTGAVDRVKQSPGKVHQPRVGRQDSVATQGTCRNRMCLRKKDQMKSMP